MRLVLADVGPLYAAAALHDQYHARAQTELDELESSQWSVVVTRATIIEAYGLILQRLGTTSAIRWIDSIRTSVGFYPARDDDYDAAYDLVIRYPDQDITLFDALLHIVSTRSGILIWTFDHHFDILGSSRWHSGM